MVVGAFEEALQQAVILAGFIPIVMATAGNVGIQSSSVAVRFEQKIRDTALPFITYSRASGGATGVRQLVTAGLGLKGIIGNRSDISGVAVAWGQPENRSLRNQYVAELFYRVQLTDSIQVTPDLQLIVEPSRNRYNDAIGVLGLRMRIVL